MKRVLGDIRLYFHKEDSIHMKGKAMKKTLLAALIAASVVLAGCQTIPPLSKEQIEAADYGPMTGDKAQQVIRAYLSEVLIDPYSYQIEFRNFKKHWGLDKSGKYHFGWVQYYVINAKNRMGGYTGKEPHWAFIENGRIIQIYSFYPSDGRVYPDWNVVDHE